MTLKIATRIARMIAVLPCLSLALSAAVTPPRPISTVAPKHPPELLAKGVDGSATVKFKVNADGTVSDATVTKATDPAFGEAAIAAVNQWQFEPATRDGEAISIKVAQKFDFQAPPEKKFEAVVGRPVFMAPPDGVISAKDLGHRPKPVVPIKAPYPPSLAGSGKEALVRVRFIINTDGLAINPEVVGVKGDKGFEPYALLAVARARWEPIEHEGKIVPVSMQVPVRFAEKPAGGAKGKARAEH